MDASLKYKLVETIINTNDDAVLNEIQALLKNDQSDFWLDLPDDLKSGIDEAGAQLDQGEGIPHDQVMKDIKSLFEKNDL
jgi:hypothetical protein